MRNTPAIKLWLGALVVALTTLVAKPAPAANLCVYQYTLSNGTVCQFVSYVGQCCVYQTASGVPCPPVCGY